MNNRMKIILCFVMAAAVVLMTFCCINYIRLKKKLQDNECMLAESREKWESIAAEKEALQADLAALESDLKEARLSYDESTERAEELKQENDTLRQEIELLKKPSE